ncbi:MAG TPA: hypothetical protein VG847_04025 [Chitinophagaceae bacterium]|nr:hypothetical protein [Chitinophagaceae bacterium]
MKHILLAAILLTAMHAAGQSDEQKPEPKRGFQKERLFTGGSATAGFSSYSTALGIAPQFGYSITDWADAGITFNLSYTSQRDYYDIGDKLRQTVYGPGAFIRLFPVNFLFASAQYEFNFIHLKYLPAPGSGQENSVANTNAGSLLLGLGYAGGRFRGSNTYYFLSVSWDVLANKNSPYVDGYGRSFPVIRAGYNIGLFQGSYNRRYNDRR